MNGYSLVDVTLFPFDDLELTLDKGELEHMYNTLGFKNLWKREKRFIATSNDWMNLYQFSGDRNEWETMFIPNGEGTFEWRLGFSITIQEDYSILILPMEDNVAFSVPWGVITQKQLSKLNGNGGISIAVKPNTKAKIERGESLARLLLISNECLRAK